MKKIHTYVLVCLYANIQAQVGINTTSPNATLHVKAATSTNQLLVTSSSDVLTFVVNQNGNVGINTPSPTNKLVVTTTGSNTGLQLPNGASQGAFLTTDNDGNTSWKTQSVIFGNVPATGLTALNFDTQYYTGANIVLIPGSWSIEFGAYAALGTVSGSTWTAVPVGTVVTTDSALWCSCSLSTTSATYTPISTTVGSLVNGSGRAGASNIGRGMRTAQIQGKVLVSPTATQTYYVFVICNNYGAAVPSNRRVGNIFGDGWERWLYASPL